MRLVVSRSVSFLFRLVSLARACASVRASALFGGRRAGRRGVATSGLVRVLGLLGAAVLLVTVVAVVGVHGGAGILGLLGVVAVVGRCLIALLLLVVVVATLVLVVVLLGVGLLRIGVLGVVVVVATPFVAAHPAGAVHGLGTLARAAASAAAAEEEEDESKEDEDTDEDPATPAVPAVAVAVSVAVRVAARASAADEAGVEQVCGVHDEVRRRAIDFRAGSSFSSRRIGDYDEGGKGGCFGRVGGTKDWDPKESGGRDQSSGTRDQRRGVALVATKKVETTS